MHSPDIAGAWDDFRENAINFYLRTRLVILLFLFVFYFAFTGFERYELKKRIAEMEMAKNARVERVAYPAYMNGVKTGLEFKKNQQGKVPTREVGK